jgi:hypothetical protein
VAPEEAPPLAALAPAAPAEDHRLLVQTSSEERKVMLRRKLADLKQDVESKKTLLKSIMAPVVGAVPAGNVTCEPITLTSATSGPEEVDNDQYYQ